MKHLISNSSELRKFEDSNVTKVFGDVVFECEALIMGTLVVIGEIRFTEGGTISGDLISTERVTSVGTLVVGGKTLTKGGINVSDGIFKSFNGINTEGTSSLEAQFSSGSKCNCR